MHYATARGDIGMVDLIFAASPAALNHGAGKSGVTPLGLMVDMTVMPPRDRESIVRHFLSLEASDKNVPKKDSALVKAVCQGDESLVRVLLDAAAGRRVGKFWGTEAHSYATVVAAGDGRAKIVKMLVTAEGAGRQQHWARVRLSDIPALFSAANRGSVSTVAILLAAGADELARDNDGYRARDFAGMGLPANDSKTPAVKRTLQRAPAHRALSWTWSTALCSKGGGAAAGGLCESSPAPVGVRILPAEGPAFHHGPV